jgi:hypothetical protein
VLCDERSQRQQLCIVHCDERSPWQVLCIVHCDERFSWQQLCIVMSGPNVSSCAFSIATSGFYVNSCALCIVHTNIVRYCHVCRTSAVPCGSSLMQNVHSNSFRAVRAPDAFLGCDHCCALTIEVPVCCQFP